ncbi:hypothetical protein C8J57DRAFT_1256633 [Mycena rebaudengoi]|nr:hypothetical protein C8J57DRAFT_1256633 [Mycena rebaudengoi]
MLQEYARQILRATGEVWDPIERRINCLAHVINLATQKLISTYSKSAHFNTHDPNAHIPDTTCSTQGLRDEIGLLRAIAVKERSSAKRKELFRGIQLRDKVTPEQAAKQMILDMKVRWSSTYAMLDRGHELKEISYDEKDREKRDKLAALQLTEDEWARIVLSSLFHAELSLLLECPKCSARVLGGPSIHVASRDPSLGKITRRMDCEI